MLQSPKLRAFEWAPRTLPAAARFAACTMICPGRTSRSGVDSSGVVAQASLKRRSPPFRMATPCLRLVASTTCQLATNSATSARNTCAPLLISPYGTSHTCRLPSGRRRSRQCGSGAVASGGDLGDFGARDPFPGEIGSDFGNRPQGWADTEHQISIPTNIRNITGLHNYSCSPVEKGTAPLSEEECKELLRKVVGWKLATVDGRPRLRGEWKVKDFSSGLELFARLAVVAEENKHHPDLHLEGYNKATADIWTHTAGGLTINDFILAAKIDQVDTRDLISKKNRAWA